MNFENYLNFFFPKKQAWHEELCKFVNMFNQDYQIHRDH